MSTTSLSNETKSSAESIIADDFVIIDIGGKPTALTLKQLSTSKAWLDCYNDVGKRKSTWMCVKSDGSNEGGKLLKDMAVPDAGETIVPMSVVRDFVNFLKTCEGVELKHLPPVGTPLRSKDAIAEIKRFGGDLVAKKVDSFLTNLSGGDRDYRSVMSMMRMSSELGCPTLMVITSIYIASIIKGLSIEEINTLFEAWEKKSTNPVTYPKRILDGEGKVQPAPIGEYHASTIKAVRELRNYSSTSVAAC